MIRGRTAWSIFLSILLASSAAEALVWPDVAERVERDLSAADASTRKAAAHQLATLGPVRGSALAVQAMNDSDDDVRLAAAEAAIRLRAPGATDVAVTWLNAPNPRLRRRACEVARALPSIRAVAALARTLGDPDAEVRGGAADALGHQASSDGVAPLLGRLDDSTPAVRIEVANALARLGDARAVVPLVGKIQDSAAEVRQAVARALGDLDDSRAASALMLALRDQSPDVRREALYALGRLRATDAVDAIAPFTFDRLPSLRVAAMDALGHMGTADALRVLISALGADDDASGGVERSPVRDALVASGAPAITALHALLGGSPSPAAAASAAWVLGALQATSEAPTIVAAMRRGVLSPSAALHALAGAGTAAEVPVVLEFVSDPSPAVRAESLEAAHALLNPNQPDGRAVEPLEAALRDSRPSIEERARLVAVVGRTGAPRAAGLLAQLVKAADPRLRTAAIDALGTLGPGGADDALLEAIASHNAEIRLHAAIALADAGAAKTRDSLLAQLDAGDEVDRAALLTALGGVMSREPSDGAVARLHRALDLAAGPERDALLDAMGRAPLASATLVLNALSRSEEPFDRRAAGSLCAAHPRDATALATARSLLSDADGHVRAQAAWSLATIGEPSDLPRLLTMAGEVDPDAATNATAAVGRITARTRSPQAAAQALCPLLQATRPLVRANALASLALAGARCGAGSAERRLLLDDPSESVRAAAAISVGRAPSAEDSQALGRCSRVDASGFVAARCRERVSVPARTHATLVYVVPEGAETPRPDASYGILLADGLVHAGAADRRGAVFDPVAPEGPMRLVPLSAP